MTREIKFRAWDEDSSTMIYCKDSYRNDLGEFYFDFDGRLVLMLSDGDCETAPEIREAMIMQFTGLIDKSGKEIYEGDIVSCQLLCPESNDCWIRYSPIVVEWEEYGYQPFIEYGIPDHSFLIEVVGNIYENPELLEVEND